MVGAEAGDPQGAALTLQRAGLRTRRPYLVAALLTIVVGLLVHRGVLPLPPLLRDKAGDALWAMMIVWWVGVVRPAAPVVWRAAVAMLVCVAVETSQLLHSPSLDALRATAPGRLVLGSGFDAYDFVAYALGVAVAMVVDARWLADRRSARR